MARILIAEDEADLRMAAVFRLKRAGHEVLEATNGKEAVDMARGGKPDIVLLDIRMPELDGIEACRRIKAGTDAVPVVLMSASLDMIEKMIREAGADAHLVKPYESKALVALIARLVGTEEAAGRN